MSTATQIGSQDEFTGEPYLLDEAAADAYGRGIREVPRRGRKNIHSDPDAAAKAGFTAPIAAGEHTIAVAMQLMVDRFGERFLRGGGFDVALIKPVFFGDRILPHARLTQVRDGRIELEIWVDNQDGARVLTGKASVGAQ
jgi:acyl dehydratase